MATVTMTIEEYEALMDLVRSRNEMISTSMPKSGDPGMPKTTTKRRKRSKYNKELSKQLRMLKVKHPRTAVTKLMKRAHRATKKALK